MQCSKNCFTASNRPKQYMTQSERLCLPILMDMVKLLPQWSASPGEDEMKLRCLWLFSKFHLHNSLLLCKCLLAPSTVKTVCLLVPTQVPSRFSLWHSTCKIRAMKAYGKDIYSASKLMRQILNQLSAIKCMRTFCALWGRLGCTLHRLGRGTEE